MLKNMFCITVKLVLLVAIFIGSFYVLTPYFRTERSKEGDYFRNLPEQSIDVLALGSSHMQYAFNPGMFYTETGKYSYVMGSSCQPFPMSYAMLQEALKTQSPEVVVVDVFTLLPQSDVCYAIGMFYKAIDEMEGMNRLDAAEYVPDDEFKLYYKYDLLMNHANWKQMDVCKFEEILENGKPAEGYNYELGYVRQEVEKPEYMPLITYDVSQKVSLSNEEYKQIDDFIALCNEHKIQPIFIKTPYIIDQENTDKLHAIWSYLDKKEVPYIDFIEKAEELHWFINMNGDTWHNNVWGAEIVTNYISEFIKEHNYIQNHKENSELKKLLEEQNYVNSYSLMNETNVNVYRLLEEASKYPCTVLLKYKGYPRTCIQELENSLFQDLGCTKDFVQEYRSDYFAIIENGELLIDDYKPFTYDYQGQEIAFDEDRILINGEDLGQHGELQVIILDHNQTVLNSFGIDYYSRWFWKNGYLGFEKSE